MKLFTLAMIEHTVDCTDYYVRTFGNYTTKKRWVDFVPDELLCVIGIVIFMGLVQLPSQRDYWKPESKGITLPIRNYMSYDRFTSIVRNLTHTTKEKKDQPKFGEPGFDKLWRIAEHLAMFLQAIGDAYVLGMWASIDEMMIAFKGYSPIRT